MKEDRLELIDMVVERTHLSFTEAKEVLEEADWDVVEALVLAEQRQKKGNKSGQQVEWTDHKTWSERVENIDFEAIGKEAWEKIKHMVKEGNIRRIVVMKEGEKLFDIPLTVGVIGGLLMPELAALAVFLGGVGSVMGKLQFKIEKVQ